MSPIPPPDELVELVKYRMRAIAIGHLALRHTMAWDAVPPMAIYFSGNQVMEGLATGFTNCAIESAIIHARSLLEFLGLKGKSSTTLQEVKDRDRRDDDHGVENFAGLRRLSIREAVAFYPGPAIEAESALAYVIYLANKGLAHTASTFSKHDEGTHLLEVAFRGVPKLVGNRFFLARGVEPPDYEITGKRRPN